MLIFPLQRTPSLEYHRLQFHVKAKRPWHGTTGCPKGHTLVCITDSPRVKEVSRQLRIRSKPSSDSIRPPLQGMRVDQQIRLTFNQDRPDWHEDDDSGLLVEESRPKLHV